jgi:hypothetical protein
MFNTPQQLNYFHSSVAYYYDTQEDNAVNTAFFSSTINVPKGVNNDIKSN